MRKTHKIKSLGKPLCFLISLLPYFAISDVWEPVANGVNGNDTALSPAKFAQELFTDGSVRISPGFATYSLGANVSETPKVTFTIVGGTWGTALTSASLTLDDVDASGSSATIILTEDGGFDDTTATFRINVLSQLTTGDELTLSYTLDDTIGLAISNSVTLAISLEDSFGKFSVDDGPSVVAESVNAILITESTTGLFGGIDLLTEITTFSDTLDPLVIKLLEFTIADGNGANDGVEDDGVTPFNLQAGDVVIRDGQIEISGSFGSSLSVDEDGDAATNDGLKISGCIERPASSFTSSMATFDLTGADIAAMRAGGTCSIFMRVDGVSKIAEFLGRFVFSIDYKNPAYDDEYLMTSLIDVVIKSNSTQFLDLLLPEESGFSHSVRVSNTGKVGDRVFATLINDQGDSVFYELLSGPLAAGSSTEMIPVDEIYQSAISIDASFTAEGGKLRLRLNSNAEISARSYIISTDKSAFNRI